MLYKTHFEEAVQWIRKEMTVIYTAHEFHSSLDGQLVMDLHPSGTMILDFDDYSLRHLLYVINSIMYLNLALIVNRRIPLLYVDLR
jgi:hypothetical protein